MLSCRGGQAIALPLPLMRNFALRVDAPVVSTFLDGKALMLHTWAMGGALQRPVKYASGAFIDLSS